MRTIRTTAVLAFLALPLLLPTGALAAAAEGKKAKSIDELAKMYDSTGCKQCHEEIYKEWVKSLHARSIFGTGRTAATIKTTGAASGRHGARRDRRRRGPLRRDAIAGEELSPAAAGPHNRATAALRMTRSNSTRDRLATRWSGARLRAVACAALLPALLACSPPPPAAAPPASGEWIEFEGSWNAAGVRHALMFDRQRRASLIDLKGTLMVAGPDGKDAHPVVFTGGPTQGILDAPLFHPDGKSLLFSAPAASAYRPPTWLEALLGAGVHPAMMP